MAVYRDYDQAGLDAQYNLRARHVDHAAIFARWAETSAEARACLGAELDVAYGTEAGMTLDIFPAAPRDGRASPILTFIHGGYWQALDKSDSSFLAPAFVAAGIAFVSLNYSLAPAADMDRIVAQIRAAHLWLRDNATHFGGDPDAMFVSGHSAGGHLTAMTLASDWSALCGGPPDLVKAGYAISGLYDLEPIRLCFLNQALGLDRAAAARNSPLSLSPNPGVGLSLVVGGAETDEFHRQQTDFAARWRARGIAVEATVSPDLHHFSIVDDMAKEGSDLNQHIVAGIQAARDRSGAAIVC